MVRVETEGTAFVFGAGDSSRRVHQKQPAGQREQVPQGGTGDVQNCRGQSQR